MVRLFLIPEISTVWTSGYSNIFIINLSEFKPYFKKKPKNVNQIIKLSTYVKLKTKLMCAK